MRGGGGDPAEIISRHEYSRMQLFLILGSF